MKRELPRVCLVMYSAYNLQFFVSDKLEICFCVQHKKTQNQKACLAVQKYIMFWTPHPTPRHPTPPTGPPQVHT